jgi:enolase
MVRIAAVHALEVLDSRGNPTLEVTARLSDDTVGDVAVPAGISTGVHEALELRDGDPSRYGGKGVLSAVKHVNVDIATAVKGRDAEDQAGLDQFLIDLDGTPNKARLGANAILGVSLAVAKAAAVSRSLPLYRALGGEEASQLPVPLMNVINGGLHADNALDMQEFMIIPLGGPNYAEALRMGVETYHALKTLLHARHLSTGLGDEGGFAPELRTAEEALDVLVAAIEKAGYRPGNDLAVGIDVAASNLFRDGVYQFVGAEQHYSFEALVEYYERLLAAYPIISIEDGMAEDDWAGWRHLTERLGGQIQLVGDDLFVTNPRRFREGIAQGLANAILLKVNQIGTLTETLEAVGLARHAQYAKIISHRSGDTEDTTIADLAVAIGAEQIKTGAPARSERVGKYNRLLVIAEELGARARFAGRAAFSRLLR